MNPIQPSRSLNTPTASLELDPLAEGSNPTGSRGFIQTLERGKLTRTAGDGLTRLSNPRLRQLAQHGLADNALRIRSTHGAHVDYGQTVRLANGEQGQFTVHARLNEQAEYDVLSVELNAPSLEHPELESLPSPSSASAARVPSARGPQMGMPWQLTEYAGDVQSPRRARVPNAPPSMSMSAGWSAHLSEQAVEDLVYEMENNGLAHVAWGTKPAFFLEEASEGGCWQHVADALSSGTKDGFALIPSRHNVGAAAESHQGYLVNIPNALATVAQNKAVFTRVFGLTTETPVETVLHQHVLPRLAEKSNADEDPEITALMLGFGADGARAYGIKSSGDPAARQSLAAATERLNTHIQQRLDALSAGNPQGVMAPGIPEFIKLDTPATRATVERYLEESRQIQNAQSSLLEKHDAADDSDDEDNELDRPRLFVSALMHSVFQEPNG